MITRLQRATQIQMAATRLLRLIELGAPEVIIEGERRLTLERLIAFPVDTAAQAAVEESHATEAGVREAILEKAGYYNDDHNNPDQLAELISTDNPH